MSYHNHRRNAAAAARAAILSAFVLVTACGPQATTPTDAVEPSDGTLAAVKETAAETEIEKPEPEKAMEPELAIATFGNGCFWCTEAVFQQLHGVEQVVSGYTGGSVKNPTYKQVCTGSTGHAEAIQIKYDSKAVSYEELLEVFWKTHDPTTLNRQGADEGPQYRSVVFYHDPQQKELAEHYKKKLDESGVFDGPIVTEISPAAEFYVAEREHQNFYRRNPNYGYCAFVIQPKLEKLHQVFSDKLKKSDK